MRRIAIVVIILMAVFTFINAYSVERSQQQFDSAQFSTTEGGA